MNASPATQPMLVVRGSIRSRVNGKPVWQAIVAVEGTEWRTVTDSAGGYVLRVPAAASRPLRLRFGGIGYRPVTHSVEQASGEIRVDATLELQPIRLGIVVKSQPSELGTRRSVDTHVTRIEGSKP